MKANSLTDQTTSNTQYLYNQYRVNSYRSGLQSTQVYCVITPYGATLWYGLGLVARDICAAIVSVMNEYEQCLGVQSEREYNRALSDAAYLLRMQRYYSYPATVRRALDWLMINEESGT